MQGIKTAPRHINKYKGLKSKMGIHEASPHRPFYELNLFHKNQTVPFAEFRLSNKVAIQQLIKKRKWDVCYIKVTYLPGVHNDGTYQNSKDASNALTIWTEKDTIDFIAKHYV